MFNGMEISQHQKTGFKVKINIINAKHTNKSRKFCSPLPFLSLLHRLFSAYLPFFYRTNLSALQHSCWHMQTKCMIFWNSFCCFPFFCFLGLCLHCEFRRLFLIFVFFVCLHFAQPNTSTTEKIMFHQIDAASKHLRFSICPWISWSLFFHPP